MNVPRVSIDPETGYGYVYLAEPLVDSVKTSVPLAELAEDEGVEALQDLVLDFDRDGRLVGIEIAGPAQRVLSSELLEAAETG